MNPPQNFNVTLHGNQGGIPDILIWLALWTIVWLLVLSVALARKDFDPVTRLTWVLVIILVPFFGVLLYAVVAPKQPRERESDCAGQPVNCVSCGTTIAAGATKCPSCGWSYIKEPQQVG
jgi:hypothetical protein